MVVEAARVPGGGAKAAWPKAHLNPDKSADEPFDEGRRVHPGQGAHTIATPFVRFEVVGGQKAAAALR